MLNIAVLSWALGLWAAVMFTLCVGYGLVKPVPHMREFLEIALPGLHWISLFDLVVGLIKSFLYGTFGAVVFAALYNFFARRWG